MSTLPLLGETDPIVYTKASADGDEFDNRSGFTEIEIWNRSGSVRTVEFVEQRNCSFGEQNVHATRLLSIDPGVKIRSRRFSAWRYNNKSNHVEMIYPDSEAGIELAALYRPFI